MFWGQQLLRNRLSPADKLWPRPLKGPRHMVTKLLKRGGPKILGLLGAMFLWTYVSPTAYAQLQMPAYQTSYKDYDYSLGTTNVHDYLGKTGTYTIPSTNQTVQAMFDWMDANWPNRLTNNAWGAISNSPATIQQTFNIIDDLFVTYGTQLSTLTWTSTPWTVINPTNQVVIQAVFNSIDTNLAARPITSVIAGMIVTNNGQTITSTNSIFTNAVTESATSNSFLRITKTFRNEGSYSAAGGGTPANVGPFQATNAAIVAFWGGINNWTGTAFNASITYSVQISPDGSSWTEVGQSTAFSDKGFLGNNTIYTFANITFAVPKGYQYKAATTPSVSLGTHGSWTNNWAFHLFTSW